MSKWQEKVAEYYGDATDRMMSNIDDVLKIQCDNWGNKYAVIVGITGIDEAYLSLKMSKRTISPDVYVKAKEAQEVFNTTGECTEYMDMMTKALVKYGIQGHDNSCRIDSGHETLLRYIDFTVLVTEIHRGAMDDFDSHGMTLNNRIVRWSTRLAKFLRGDGYSDWYKGKIIHLADALDDIPEKIVRDGETYTFGEFGYIREDLVGDRDVERGTYPISIPSSCLVKINLHALRHIYKRRNEKTHAAPELAMMIEELERTSAKLLPPAMKKVISHDWVLVNGTPAWHPIHDVYKVAGPNGVCNNMCKVDTRDSLNTITDVHSPKTNIGDVLERPCQEDSRGFIDATS